MIVYSVEELNVQIKSGLENLLPNICIRGEVYDFKATSGHWYFALKDASSMIKVIVWYRPNRKVLTNGEVIEAKGLLNYYQKNSTISLIIQEWSIINKQGDILMYVENLKLNYERSGYFNKVNKLPSYIDNIVIITSEEGAALKDFLFVLNSKYQGKLCILNSLVQGEKAPDDISSKIDMALSLSPQILVLARGGGSLDDLMPFSNPKVVESLQKAKLSGIYTISAVGHETDHMLTDFVADHRAPTPSLAGEYIVAHNQRNMQEFKNTVDMFGKELSSYRRRNQELIKYFQVRIRFSEFHLECLKYLQLQKNHNFSIFEKAKPKLFLEDSNGAIIDLNKLTKIYQVLYLVSGKERVKVSIKLAKN